MAPDVDIGGLARRTDGFTGADVETVCKKATLLAIDISAPNSQSGARVEPAFVVR